jgi:signal transduction histidine kinase
VLERDPHRAGQALTAIQDTARTALDELRAEVASLQPSTSVPEIGAGAEDAARSPRHPDGGIADLPRLIDRIRSGGIPVVLDVDPLVGTRPVPAATDHAAYRIVQEALTNVLRHGGSRAAAHVEVLWTDADLVVEITNTSPRRLDGATAGTTVSPGMGIRGMRRRAQLLGGSVDAGKLTDGGFRVSARLPLGSPVPAHRP